MLVCHTDARVRARVLPVCHRITACVNNSSPRLLYAVRVLSGTSGEKYTSSSEEVFLWPQFSRRLFQRAEEQCTRGSPCSPPSAWTMRCKTFILPHVNSLGQNTWRGRTATTLANLGRCASSSRNRFGTHGRTHQCRQMTRLSSEGLHP